MRFGVQIYTARPIPEMRPLQQSSVWVTRAARESILMSNYSTHPSRAAKLFLSAYIGVGGVALHKGARAPLEKKGKIASPPKTVPTGHRLAHCLDATYH